MPWARNAAHKCPANISIPPIPASGQWALKDLRYSHYSAVWQTPARHAQVAEGPRGVAELPL